MRFNIRNHIDELDDTLVPDSRKDLTYEMVQNCVEILRILESEYDNPETQEEYQKIKESLELVREFENGQKWVVEE